MTTHCCNMSPMRDNPLLPYVANPWQPIVVMSLIHDNPLLPYVTNVWQPIVAQCGQSITINCCHMSPNHDNPLLPYVTVFAEDNTYLTLPMLRLLSSKPQGCKDFWKPSKSCHVSNHWKALPECFIMSTHVNWVSKVDISKILGSPVFSREATIYWGNSRTH